MKKLLTAICLFMSLSAFAQSDYNILKDKENGAIVYKGQIISKDLENDANFPWFKEGITAYKPDSIAIKYLQQHLAGYDLVVFLGTWCDDSQNLIPKLYKVLQLTNYHTNNMLIYGVDRAKTTKNGYENKLYTINKVPTIIVFKNNVEVGRITEIVRKSVEVDLVQIINADSK